MLLNIFLAPLPRSQLSTQRRGSCCGKLKKQKLYWWELTLTIHTPGIRYVLLPCHITALDRVSGQIGWSSHLSEGVRCLQSDDCLPDEWSESDFVNCCILGRSVKEEIANKAAPGLIFLMDKLPLSELTYEYEGVIYQSACAVYGGMGPECDALQAVDRQTGGVLWMMTFQGKGMNDFSIANGILYVFTDEGVGAFEL